MCSGSELTMWWLFMMPYWSCEVAPALLICPSWAWEREGAHLCREKVSVVQQGADGSHLEPKGICEKPNHSVRLISFFRGKIAKFNKSLFGGWWTDVFPFFSQGPKTWGAGVFLRLMCEWVGGSFVVKNQGLKSTQVRSFLHGRWWDLWRPSEDCGGIYF